MLGTVPPLLTNQQIWFHLDSHGASLPWVWSSPGKQSSCHLKTDRTGPCGAACMVDYRIDHIAKDLANLPNSSGYGRLSSATFLICLSDTISIYITTPHSARVLVVAMTPSNSYEAMPLVATASNSAVHCVAHCASKRLAVAKSTSSRIRVTSVDCMTQLVSKWQSVCQEHVPELYLPEKIT